MIRFEAVDKFFNRVQVLRDLSFHVRSGERVALLGLSGSGKTTALKLITGLHRADSGRIFVNNAELTSDTLESIRSSIGYVIQDGGLFPHLTGLQNLELVASAAGWEKGKTRARIEELAQVTHLSFEVLEKYPRQLSGGQRQRIGLMRALLKDPPLLLLDEPLGALDPITRTELQVELREISTRLQKTVVLVTHDLFEAGYLADRILLLCEGQILQEGTLQDLVRAPATPFVKTFVESQKRIEAP